MLPALLSQVYKSCVPNPFSYSSLPCYNTRKMDAFIQSEQTIPALYFIGKLLPFILTLGPCQYQGEKGGVSLGMGVYDSLFAIPNLGDQFIL